MKKSHPKSITDFIIRTENAATVLNAADVALNDSLLVAMVLKGLPDDFAPFVEVITQQERIHDFQKSKQALRNFDETENTRINKRDEVSKNAIMKTENTFGTNSKKKGIICYSCGITGDKASKCRGAVVITSAQLHSTKYELRFCAGSNPARGVSEICDGENL